MNKLDTFKYVFGPVPSRRLGRSLGVDLVPFKSCSFDCVYCQVGRTTDKTLERREFVPLDDVLAEVERKLAGDVFPDYITMSGSGEPTLYSRLGELIRGIKARAEVPVAVLTNGSLLSDPAVREELLAADLVVPSLDAGGEALYRRVNRPHIDATYEKLVEGLIAFREAYENALWLEVFLLGSITDDEARALAETASRVNPDRIQLNTVARPPAEAGRPSHAAGPHGSSAAAIRGEGGDHCRLFSRASMRSHDGHVGRNPRHVGAAAVFRERHCGRSRHLAQRGTQARDGVAGGGFH